MNSRKKLLGFYDESEGLGGTTRYLFDLIDGLDRDRFEPVFFAPRWQSWQQELVKREVEVHTIDDGRRNTHTETQAVMKPPTLLAARRSGSARWIAGAASEVRNLRKLFLRFRPEILHSNNVGAEAGPIAARLAGVPVIGTLHVDPSYDLFGTRQGMRYLLFEKACFNSLNKVISVSAATWDCWRKRLGTVGRRIDRRVSVVHNGIDAARLQRRKDSKQAKRDLGISADTFVIGSLGRLDYAKGYEYLIRGIAHLKMTDIQVVIAGRGPLEDQLRKMAEELGVTEQITFAGFRSDVRDILEASDIYVQCSLCEALPYSVLEAMATGLPTIVSRVGGMPEMVQPGISGMIVAARDPESLSQAIASFKGDECLVRRAGDVAQKMAKQDFSLDKMRSGTYQVYEDLIREECPEQPSVRGPN